MKKILAIFTLTGFLCSSVFGEVLHAAAGTMADAAQFKPAFNDLLIPPACGRITDTYIVPAPEGNSAKMPLVINIQDLHCHAEVQRNIAKILAALDSKYGLNKVYVEGGYGTVDTSWLCSLEDKGLKKEIVEKLIDQGKLTGSEVYSITANRPDVLQGLEDKSLHQQNIVRLGKILAQKAYFETEIKGLERDLELMKAKYFTVKNRKFNDVVARHRNGELSSNKYYLLLTSYAETINRNPDKFNALLTIEKSDYPEIYNYAELIRISKELNYRRISRQLQEFMQVLKSRVPYNVYNALLEKTDNFSRTDELYLYLTELSETPGLKELRRDYPDLYRFFTYTRKNRSINPVRLIDEEKRLVEEIRIGLSKDVSELEVAFLADFFGYFQDYLLNRLSADDYAYFVKRFDKFQKLWGKYAFRNRVAGLSKDFPLLNEYYEVNAERNELFLQHIAEIKAEGAGAGGKTEDHSPLLSESVIPGIAKDATVIVMVTGGFHTEGLKKLFRERAVSYLTITPNITSDAALSDHVYTEMAKRQAKLFSGQALALALGSTEARIVSVGKDRIVVSLGKDEITLQREGEQQPFKLDKGSQKLKGLFDPVQLEAAVNEAVRIAAKIEPMPNPALRSTLILELVKVFSVSAVREGIFFGGNGLIWSIATNDKVLQIIEKRGGVSADELSQLPDSIQELIEAYSLQEEGQSERARGNALISAILQVPELKLYIASKAKALKEQQSRGKNNDAGGALTAGLSYAFGGWLFEALWGKPLPADDAGRARIKRASELLASFNPFDILPLHLWEMATGRSEATPKRILGTTMILGAAAAAWHLALGIGMIYIIHSLTHLAYNLAVPGEPLTAGGGHKRDEKLTRIKGYKEYGEAISTYYRARRQLVEAIGNRDINAYTTAYDTFFRSAKAVKEAYQNNELDLQALVETMQKEGLLVTLSYKDAQGNEFSGPWDEILKIGGETFSEKHHRWITESIDTLIQAFPKSQQKAVEAVREKIIKNTFAFSGEHLIPSPDRIRQAMDQATGDAGLQSIREFLLESLTDAAEFKYGFTLPFQAEPEIVMHALKEEDWFRAVYMHEIGHYLFRTGIIDLPQMEIITHAISSIWLGGSDYPELFASGIAWAEKNRGKEISVNELEQVSYEGVVTNWAALGFSSMGTAMQVPHLVQSGQIEMEDYQRWVGAALGGVLYRQSERDRLQALKRTVIWADAVLAKETDNVSRFHPDITRRNNIVSEVEGLLQLITDKDIRLIEQRQSEGKRSVFSISEDRKSIYYAPELLDHPDEEVARALFFEQIFSLLYSEPGWVEPSYRDAVFMSLFAIMEIGRTRNQGLKKYAGLKGAFQKLNQAFYPNVRSESAKRKMNNLPLIVQFMEASLYEGRMTVDGKSMRDPRVKNSAVRKALRATARARRKAIEADSTRDSYLVVRDEIWPLLQKLIAMTEDQMKRQLERQEGRTPPDQVKAAGEQQSMEEAVEEMLRQALQQLRGEQEQRQNKDQEKSEEGMEGENGMPGGTGAVNEAVRRMLQDMLEQMEGTNPQVASAKQQLQSEQRQATQQTMEEAVASARRQLDEMNRNLDALADRVGEAKGQSDHLGAEAGRLRDQTGTEPLNRNDVQKLEDIVSQIDDQAGQLADNGRALKNDATRIKQNSTKMDENIAPSAGELKDSSWDLDTKVNRINDAINELNKKVDELKSRLEGLQKTVEQHHDTPTQRTGVSKVQDRNEEIAESLNGIKEMTGTVQDSLEKVMEDVRRVGKEIEALNKKAAETGTAAETGVEGMNGGEKAAEAPSAGEGAADAGSKEDTAKAPAAGNEDGTQQEKSHAEDGAWGPNFSNPNPSAVNETTRRIMEQLRKQQEIDSSMIDVSKRRSGDKAEDTFFRDKTGLTVADQVKMKALFKPYRAAAQVLHGAIKRNLQESQLARDMGGLSEGDLDDQNLHAYKQGRSFKRELLPGRVRHRIMFVVFNTCSKCRLRDPNSSIAYAYKALIISLLAVKGLPGVEVGAMMYGEDSGERLLLPLTDARKLTEEDIYRMDKPLNRTCGSASDIATLDEAAELISRDATADTLQTIVHFGDGNPGARSLHPRVMELYRKHARSNIKWGSFGVGPKTAKGEKIEHRTGEFHVPQKIEIDYAVDPKKDRETARLFHPGLAPVAGWIEDPKDLGKASSNFVEKIFKRHRPVSALGERISDVISLSVHAAAPEAALVLDWLAEAMKWPRDRELHEYSNGLSSALRQAPHLASWLLLLLMRGKGNIWLMSNDLVMEQYGEVLKYLPKGTKLRVSTAPLDLMVPRRDAYVFATTEVNDKTGEKTVVIHRSFLDTLMQTGPPDSFIPKGDRSSPDADARAKGEFTGLLLRHETEESDFISLVIEALAAENFSALKDKYPKLSDKDIAFLISHPDEAYEIFHKLTEKEYAPLFEFAQTIVASNEDIVYMGYIRKDGKTYLRLAGPDIVEPIEVEVNPRDNNRVVKLFVKKGGEWVRLRPGIDLGPIPAEIAYSISRKDIDPSTLNETNYFAFTKDNLATLAKMLKIHTNPNPKNSNLGMIGPKGAGKDTLISIMLGVLGEPQRMMGLHAHTTMSELKERPVITTELKPVTLKNRKTGEEAEYLMPSVNVNIVLAEPYEAARHGETVRFGEVDKIKIPGNLSAVNSLLTRHEEDLEGMDGGIDPRFRAIADRNTHEGGDVHGQDLADTASDFIGRFQWVSVGYMEPDSELDYVMRTVFRDLPRATAQERADYADREAVMAAVVNLAGLIRKAAKDEKVPSTMSPRAVIAIARHLKQFPNDLNYFRSVFEKAYNTELLETGKNEIEKAFKLVGLPNRTFPDDFDQVGNTFDYEVKDGRVYATLGENEWKVRVLTGYTPEQIEWVKKEKLRDEFHIQQNMMFFWQVMKDRAMSNRVMILGVPGTGKTELVTYLLNDVLGLDAKTQVVNVATRGDDLLGRWRISNDTMVFEPSKEIVAMEAGKPVIVDEIDKTQDDTVLSATNSIGQFRQVTLPDRTVAEAEQGFSEFYLGNLANKGGTSSQKISGEVLDRSSVYVMKPLSEDQTVEILRRYAGKHGYNIDIKFIKALVKVHFFLMKKAEDRDLPHIPNMRTLEGVIDSLGRHSEDYLNLAEIYLQGYSLEYEDQKDIVREAFDDDHLGIESGPGVKVSANKVAMLNAIKAIARFNGYTMDDTPAGELATLIETVARLKQEGDLPATFGKAGIIKLVKTVARQKGGLVWLEGAELKTIADVMIAGLRPDSGKELLDSHKKLILDEVEKQFEEVDNKLGAFENNRSLQKLLAESGKAIDEMNTSEALTQGEKTEMAGHFEETVSKVKSVIKKPEEIISGTDDDELVGEQIKAMAEAESAIEALRKDLSGRESVKKQQDVARTFLTNIPDAQSTHETQLSGDAARGTIGEKEIKKELEDFLKYITANRYDRAGINFSTDLLFKKWEAVEKVLKSDDVTGKVYTKEHVTLLKEIYRAGIEVKKLHSGGTRTLKSISKDFEEIASLRKDLIDRNDLGEFFDSFSDKTFRWHSSSYLNNILANKSIEESFHHMLVGLLVKETFNTSFTESLYIFIRDSLDHADLASLNRWFLPVWEETVAQQTWSTTALARIAHVQHDGSYVAEKGWEKVFALVSIYQTELQMPGTVSSAALATRLKELQTVTDKERRKDLESIIRAAPVDAYAGYLIPYLVDAVKKNEAIRNFVRRLPMRGASEAFMLQLMSTLLLEAVIGNDNAKRAVQSLRGSVPKIVTKIVNDTIGGVNSVLATSDEYKDTLQAWDNAEAALKILDPDLVYHDKSSQLRLEDLYFAHIVSGSDPGDEISEKVALKIAEYLGRFARKNPYLITNTSAKAFLKGFEEQTRDAKYMKTKFLPSARHQTAFGIIVDALSAGKKYHNFDISYFGKWVNDYGKDWDMNTAGRIRTLNRWLMPLWKNVLKEPLQIELIKETNALDKPENASLLAAWEDAFAEVRKSWNEKPAAAESGAGALDEASLIEVLKGVIPAADDAVRQAVAGHIAASIAGKFTADIIAALVKTGTLHEAIKKQVGAVISSPSIDTISQALFDHIMAIQEPGSQFESAETPPVDSAEAKLIVRLEEIRTVTDERRRKELESMVKAAPVDVFTVATVPALIGAIEENEAIRDFAVTLSAKGADSSFMNALKEQLLVSAGKGNENAKTIIQELGRKDPSFITAKINARLDHVLDHAKEDSDDLGKEWKLVKAELENIDGDFKYYDKDSGLKLIDLYFAYLNRTKTLRTHDAKMFLEDLGEHYGDFAGARPGLIDDTYLFDFIARFEKITKSRTWADYLGQSFLPDPELKAGFAAVIGPLSAGRKYSNKDIIRLTQWVRDFEKGVWASDHKAEHLLLNQWFMPVWENIAEKGKKDSLLEEIATRDADGAWKAKEGWEEVVEFLNDLSGADTVYPPATDPAGLEKLLNKLIAAVTKHERKKIVKAIEGTEKQVFTKKTVPPLVEAVVHSRLMIDPVTAIIKDRSDHEVKKELVSQLADKAGEGNSHALKVIEKVRLKDRDIISRVINNKLEYMAKFIKIAYLNPNESKEGDEVREEWDRITTVLRILGPDIYFYNKIRLTDILSVYTTSVRMGAMENEENVQTRQIPVAIARFIKDITKKRQYDVSDLLVDFRESVVTLDQPANYVPKIFMRSKEQKEAFGIVVGIFSAGRTYDDNEIGTLIRWVYDFDQAEWAWNKRDRITTVNQWLMPVWRNIAANGQGDRLLLDIASFGSIGGWKADEGWEEVVAMLTDTDAGHAQGAAGSQYAPATTTYELMQLLAEVVADHTAAEKKAIERAIADTSAPLFAIAVVPAFVRALIADPALVDVAAEFHGNNLDSSFFDQVLIELYAEATEGNDEAKNTSIALRDRVPSLVTDSINKMLSEMISMAKFGNSTTVKDEMVELKAWLDFWDPEFANYDRTSLEHLMALYQISLTYGEYRYDPIQEFAKDVAKYLNKLAKARRKLVHQDDLIGMLQDFEVKSFGWSGGDDYVFSQFMPMHQAAFRDVAEALTSGQKYSGDDIERFKQWVIQYDKPEWKIGSRERIQAINQWLMPAWKNMAESELLASIATRGDDDVWKAKEGWEEVVESIKGDSRSAILPWNLQRVNRWANEGRSARNIAIRIALAEFFDSLQPATFVAVHKHRQGAQQVVNAGRAGGRVGAVLGLAVSAAVVTGFAAPAAPLVMLALGAVTGFAAGTFTANITAHAILDYRYLKESGLTDEVKKFGAATIDENGAVRTNIYIMDKRTENMDWWGWKNTGINIDGKPLWASTKAGAVVLFVGDGDGRDIPSEVNSLLTGKGRIAAGRRAVERFKGFFRSVNVDLGAQGFKEGIIIDPAATDGRIRYEDGSMVVPAQFFGDLTGADARDVLAAKLGRLMTIREAESMAMPPDIYIRLDKVERFEEFMANLEVFNRVGSRQMIIDPAVFDEKGLSFEELKAVAELARKSGTIISLDLTKDGSKKDLYLKAGFTKFTVTTGSGTRMRDPVSDLDMEAAVISGYSDVRELRDKMIASKEVIKILNLSELEGLIKGEQRDIIDRVALTEILRTTILSLYSANTLSEEYVRNVGYAWNRDKLPVLDDQAKLAALAGTVADAGSTVEQIVQAMGIKDGSSAVAVYLVKLQAEVRGTGREVELPQLQKAFLTAITEKMLARARLDAEEKFDGLADNELEIILGQKLLKQIVKKAGTAKPSITADEFKKQNGNDKMVVFLSKLNLKIRELSTDDSPEAISAVIELITQLAERKVRFDQGKKAILFDPQSVAAVLKAA